MGNLRRIAFVAVTALGASFAAPLVGHAAWKFEENGPYRIDYQWTAVKGEPISRFPVKPTGRVWERVPPTNIVDTYPEIRSVIQLPFNKPTAF